jgi:ubiquinone/menaquinone biosynthesis C-methylase UbiE
MEVFAALYAPSASTSILDVGGSELNWTLITQQPRVTLLNVDDEVWERGRFRKIKGDGRTLAFADNSYDVAYSNSVIEHVGGWEEQSAFANEIRRVARQYYVQTPNRQFIIEPHLIAAFIHLLPFWLTRRLVRWFSVWGWVTTPTQARVDEYLRSIRLIDRAEMKQLFPDAEIIEERFLGMTKSLIASRR